MDVVRAEPRHGLAGHGRVAVPRAEMLVLRLQAAKRVAAGEAAKLDSQQRAHDLARLRRNDPNLTHLNWTEAGVRPTLRTRSQSL